ncbi:MAG: nitroreductase [Chakrabartia sp.]
MFNDTSSPIALLQTRRSGKPRNMVAPGPSADDLSAILQAATRVPDHGKLAPWRFVIVAPDQRATLSDVLTTAYRAEKPDAGRLEIESLVQFAHQAPTLIVALSCPVTNSKVPTWEQELSVGAACMQLLNATHALGYLGSWLTGWPTYSDAVRNAFGNSHERIAGFLFLGSVTAALEERPRPDPRDVISHWQR